MNQATTMRGNSVPMNNASPGGGRSDGRLGQYLKLLEAQESVALANANNKENADPLDLDDGGGSIHRLVKSGRQELRRDSACLISSSPRHHCAKTAKSEKKSTTAPKTTEREVAKNSAKQVPQYPFLAPPGASEAAVAKLPRARPGPAEFAMFENDASTCAICSQSRFGSHHTLFARLPCGHVYHFGCAVTWLRKNCACPECHYELETDVAEYEVGRRERMKNRPTVSCSCPENVGMHDCFFLPPVDPSSCVKVEEDGDSDNGDDDGYGSDGSFGEEAC